MQEVSTDSAIASIPTIMIPADALTLMSGVPWPVSKEIGIGIGNVVVPVEPIVSHLQQRLLLKMENP